MKLFPWFRCPRQQKKPADQARLLFGKVESGSACELSGYANDVVVMETPFGLGIEDVLGFM